jgi:hypothetical protein
MWASPTTNDGGRETEAVRRQTRSTVLFRAKDESVIQQRSCWLVSKVKKPNITTEKSGQRSQQERR